MGLQVLGPNASSRRHVPVLRVTVTVVALALRNVFRRGANLRPKLEQLSRGTLLGSELMEERDHNYILGQMFRIPLQQWSEEHIFWVTIHLLTHRRISSLRLYAV